MFFRRLLLPAIAALSLAGCQKKLAGPPQRYLILRFENLSGDPSMEWLARGASEYLSRALSGAMDGPVLHTSAISRLASTLGPRPASAPGISTEQSAALAAGATRIITGYIDRANGAPRIQADEIDLASGKSTRSLSASASEPLRMFSALARAFSPTAQPYLTDNAEALRLYVLGYEGSGDQAVSSLERAVQTDPGFGPAWALLIDAALARGDRTVAESLIDRARHRQLDRFDRANIDLSSAVLRNDRAGRLEAIRQITALSPGDTVLLRSTAEADERTGDFEQSAAEWNQLAAVLPNDADAWNQLGYTRAWGGDYYGAIAALHEYARLRPDDVNPLDSMGDVHYLYRHFSDAANAYSEVNRKNPGFQNGGDAYKAAWAKFRAGDKPGAEAAFASFAKARDKAPGTTLLKADWLYRTGRKNEAISLLRSQTDQDSKSQLVVWELLQGNRPDATSDAASMGVPKTVPALLARFAALPSASPKEWEQRAAGISTEPLRPIALGYALLLDKARNEAVPVWKSIAETAAGTDFFTRAIYAKLQGKQPKFAMVPDPNGVNQFAALLEEL